MRVEANERAARRIDLLDVLRGVALIAMAIYHFTWDLEFFGYLPRGFAQEGGWRLFARGIATSFLILVGISLVLAHRHEIRWRPFAKRLAQVAAGALAITVVTMFVTPQSYVFFGILHQIAVASVIGLAFVRLPFFVTLLGALAVIGLPQIVATDVTDPRWLAWIGFSVRAPISNDFVPLFPWTGAVLIGMGLAQALERFAVWPRLAGLNAHLRPARFLRWLGRHSLAFYLLHQPISIGLVAAWAQFMPPDQKAMFQESCRQTCSADRDAAFCTRYCGCVQTELEKTNLLAKLLVEQLTEDDQSSVRDTVSMCSFSSEP